MPSCLLGWVSCIECSSWNPCGVPPWRLSCRATGAALALGPVNDRGLFSRARSVLAFRLSVAQCYCRSVRLEKTNDEAPTTPKQLSMCFSLGICVNVMQMLYLLMFKGLKLRTPGQSGRRAPPGQSRYLSIHHVYMAWGYLRQLRDTPERTWFASLTETHRVSATKCFGTTVDFGHRATSDLGGSRHGCRVVPGANWFATGPPLFIRWSRCKG